MRFCLAITLSFAAFGYARADDVDPNVTVQDLNAEVFRLKQTAGNHEARLKELERRLAAQDGKLDAILAAVKPPNPVTATPKPGDPGTAPGLLNEWYGTVDGKWQLLPGQKTYGAQGTRAPIGHTHTCANGHTWDHSENPGHTCQFCGLSQTIQDQVPRMVTVAPQPTLAGSVAAPQQAPQQVYSFQSSGYSLGSGGCANGSCQAPQTTVRRGIFGFRR